MRATIQCNTTLQVMCTIPEAKAVCMVLEGKAYSLKGTGRFMHSPSVTVEIPRIIVMSTYVDEYARNEHMTKFIHKNINDEELRSRRVILERDNHTCAYCGEYGDTVDHIHPLSRGGTWRWDNVITSCLECNGKKSDYLLDELGWKLLYEPRKVNPYEYKRLYKREQAEVYDALENFSV